MKRFLFRSGWSIRYKILLSFWGVVLCFSLVFGVFSYVHTRNTITAEYGLSALEAARQLNYSLDHFQHDKVNALEMICYSKDVQTALQNSLHPKNKSSYLELSTSNFPLIFQPMSIYEDISSIVLYSLNPEVMPFHVSYSGTMYPVPDSIAEIQDTWLYEVTMMLNGKALWSYLSGEGNPFFTTAASNRIEDAWDRTGNIVLCKKVKDLTTIEDLGLGVMTVDHGTLLDTYQSFLDSGYSVLLLDREKWPISGSGFLKDDLEFWHGCIPSGPDAPSEGYLVQRHNSDSYMLSYCSDNYLDWIIVCATPNTAAHNSIVLAGISIVFFLLGCIVLSFWIYYLFSARFTRPIQALQHSMERFQSGSFEETLPVQSRDELGALTTDYNNMVKRVHTMIEKNYLTNLKLREAELNALQAQINPHFLYNTLDTILVKAESAREEEIAEMIYSLSRIFRLSLNCGKVYTTVAKEKELLSSYLYLQKVRFRSRLEYEVRIESAIDPLEIPKLILQPFVENAIVHGLKDKMDVGHLLVLGYQEPEHLYFCISDDGVGMPPDRLAQLQASISCARVTQSAPDSNHSGYAVVNVAERLRLAYGEHYELRLTSTPGVGSCVELRIPRFPKNKELS